MRWYRFSNRRFCFFHRLTAPPTRSKKQAARPRVSPATFERKLNDDDDDDDGEATTLTQETGYELDADDDAIVGDSKQTIDLTDSDEQGNDGLPSTETTDTQTTDDVKTVAVSVTDVPTMRVFHESWGDDTETNASHTSCVTPKQPQQETSKPVKFALTLSSATFDTGQLEAMECVVALVRIPFPKS